MGFKIIISSRAYKEIDSAIEFYKERSNVAPQKFVATLNEAYHSLEISPFFRKRYKNVRAFKIKKYPYSLYFIVNESRSIVRILSCFHNKRSPKSRPFY